MKQKVIINLIVLMLIHFVGLSQVPSPGKVKAKPTLIRYGTAHIGNGTVIKNAYIELQGQTISRVWDANTGRINEADYDTIINADGKDIYPGFIILDSRLGLTEIDAVKATHDFDETGSYLPNISALSAYNASSKIISTVRTNGVLMGQIAPVGGVISGASSAVHFDAWNWKDATVKKDEGIYLNWPKRYKQTGWWAEPGGNKVNKKYREEVDEIITYFNQAKAYAEMTQQKKVNLRFEAMRPLFAGQSRLYIRVDKAKDILDVVQFVRTTSLEKVAIVGGSEAHLVITELRENDIPVIIDRVHRLPNHTDDPIDEPYAIASLLQKEGIQIAFATNGDMEAMISRNLPFQVGTAVYYGLPYEAAIEALTLSPARLLGIDSTHGSLTAGKYATLFISDGEALDIPTNSIVFAMVEGRIIALTNHQTELYDKFKKKHDIKP